MKLSVIVPTLDGRVPQTLRNQVAGCDEVELILVRGLSPVGKARNEGLRRASGDYVAWVDADDEVASCWLPEIRAALASEPDVVLFDAEPVGHRRPPRLAWDHAPGGVEPRDLLNAVYGNERLPCHLFRFVTRRALWDGLLFDETLRACEDFLLLPQVLLRARRIEYRKAEVYRYLFRADSLIATVSVPRLGDYIRAALRRFDETPAAYRTASAFGTVWAIYDAIEAARVIPAYRRAGEIGRTDERAGLVFLCRHGLRAVRTPRGFLRLVSAMIGFWWPQRALYRWRAARTGSDGAWIGVRGAIFFC